MVKETTKQHYREVLVEKVKSENGEIKTNELKVVRPRVLITDEQAEHLNEGVLGNEEKFVSFYVKAEEEKPKAAKKAEKKETPPAE